MTRCFGWTSMQSTNQLTPAQRALVEDNLALVGWTMKKMRGMIAQSRLSREDAYQAGCYGLCLAARRWEPSKGALSTYAARAIQQRIQLECNANYAATAGSETMRKHPELHVHAASLDKHVPGTELPLFSLLEDPAAQAHMEGGTIATELLEALTERERYVIERLLEGWQSKEIAHAMGVSPQMVHVIKKRAQKRAKRYMCGKQQTKKRKTKYG